MPNEAGGEPSIKDISEQEFSRVWTIYKDLSAYEGRFNNLMVGVRRMAASWVVAALGAVGGILLLTIKKDETPAFIYGQGDLIAVICALTFAGIAVLSVIDIRVYHHLLHSVFSELVKLERDYLWLPGTRHRMLRISDKNRKSHQNTSGVGITSLIFLYYLILQLTLLTIFVWAWSYLKIGANLQTGAINPRVAIFCAILMAISFAGCLSGFLNHRSGQDYTP